MGILYKNWTTCNFTEYDECTLYFMLSSVNLRVSNFNISLNLTINAIELLNN